jgi:hypothetical protein
MYIAFECKCFNAQDTPSTLKAVRKLYQADSCNTVPVVESVVRAACDVPSKQSEL